MRDLTICLVIPVTLSSVFTFYIFDPKELFVTKQDIAECVLEDLSYCPSMSMIVNVNPKMNQISTICPVNCLL